MKNIVTWILGWALLFFAIYVYVSFFPDSGYRSPSSPGIFEENSDPPYEQMFMEDYSEDNY